MSNWVVSLAGQAFIEKREGCVLFVYDDATGLALPLGQTPKGNATVGIGHLCSWYDRVQYAKGITKAQAYQILGNDLKIVNNVLNQYVKVPLAQWEVDALGSLIFNIGKSHFIESTLLKLLNRSLYNLAGEQFLVWNKGGNPLHVLADLVERRQLEQNLYLKGTYA